MKSSLARLEHVPVQFLDDITFGILSTKCNLLALSTLVHTFTIYAAGQEWQKHCSQTHLIVCWSHHRVLGGHGSSQNLHKTGMILSQPTQPSGIFFTS